LTDAEQQFATLELGHVQENGHYPLTLSVIRWRYTNSVHKKDIMLCSILKFILPKLYQNLTVSVCYMQEKILYYQAVWLD